MNISSSMRSAAAGMALQSERIRHISENIANIDTPGYRRKLTVLDIPSAESFVAAGDVRLDMADLPQIFDPSNPLSDASGYYQGSNVDLVIEIADAREAQRGYEANMKMFDQSRQMIGSLLELLKR